MQHLTTQSLADYISVSLYEETKKHVFIFNEEGLIFSSSNKSLVGMKIDFNTVMPTDEEDIFQLPSFASIKESVYIPIPYKGRTEIYVALEGDLETNRTFLRMLVQFVIMWLSFKERILNIQQTHEQILENIQEGYYEVNLSGDFTFFNRALMDNLGYTEFEMLGMNYRSYTSEETAKLIFEKFSLVYTTGKPIDMFRFQYIRKNGEIFDAEVSVNLMYDDANEPIGFCGIVRDITERKKAEELITFYAYHDPLTSLPNRRLFEETLEKAINDAETENKRLAVLFLDLDGFKQVNDTLGHAAGDDLLRMTAERLTNHFNKKAFISRLGGDEFTILIDNLELIQEVEIEAKALLELFQKRFTVSGRDFTITASIGCSFFPDNGKTSEELMKCADIAMYEAKQNGKNRYYCYREIAHARALPQKEIKK